VHFLPEGICDKEKCKVAEKILFVSPLETATGRRILGTKEKQIYTNCTQNPPVSPFNG